MRETQLSPTQAHLLRTELLFFLWPDENIMYLEINFTVTAILFFVILEFTLVKSVIYGYRLLDGVETSYE